MPRNQRAIGECPRCGQGNYACSYNHFQSDELRIDSWEHKCPDCGHRETQAFRSDDEDLADDINPEICPLCGRSP